MTIAHFLCRAGWHAPLPGGRWNNGYCFTACRRCGRDMVRSAFGEWHVPDGFRVVWAAQPPADLAGTLQARDDAARPDASAAPVAQAVASAEERPVVTPTPTPTPRTAVAIPPPSPPAQAPVTPAPQPAVATPPAPPPPCGKRSPFSFDDFD